MTDTAQHTAVDFHQLVESHQAELHAHCYRMLGSLHDADDAVQETLLRVWRALSGFRGESSPRTWLYRIATNVCLDVIARRPKRILPIDYGPSTPLEAIESDRPLSTTPWIEPYPDRALGVANGAESPEARYERREALELAFIAALQHLPPIQRSALVLCDVLGFSAKEAAASLGTTVASVNGALRRARRGGGYSSTPRRVRPASEKHTVRQSRALGNGGLTADAVESPRCAADPYPGS